MTEETLAEALSIKNQIKEQVDIMSNLDVFKNTCSDLLNSNVPIPTMGPFLSKPLMSIGANYQIGLDKFLKDAKIQKFVFETIECLLAIKDSEVLELKAKFEKL